MQLGQKKVLLGWEVLQLGGVELCLERAGAIEGVQVATVRDRNKVWKAEGGRRGPSWTVVVVIPRGEFYSYAGGKRAIDQPRWDTELATKLTILIRVHTEYVYKSISFCFVLN